MRQGLNVVAKVFDLLLSLFEETPRFHLQPRKLGKILLESSTSSANELVDIIV